MCCNCKLLYVALDLICFTGVCALENKIYCVGGWNGQVGIKQCDVFDPETSTWSSIASLNIGNFSAILSFIVSTDYKSSTVVQQVVA